MRKPLFTIVLAVLVAIAGSVMAEDERAEAYMVLEGQMNAHNLVGLVPEGIRLESYSSGEFTDGLLLGATGEWVDYLLIRHDGVRVIDVRGYADDPNGMPVVWSMKGFFGEPSPPPLEVRIEAMLDPEFEFPDVEFPIHGAAWFQTMAPEHAYLNHTVFGFTGTLNPYQGKMRITFRPVVDSAH
jgi:hypothetical protein